jgi:hypothetical protein
MMIDYDDYEYFDYYCDCVEENPDDDDDTRVVIAAIAAAAADGADAFAFHVVADTLASP